MNKYTCTYTHVIAPASSGGTSQTLQANREKGLAEELSHTHTSTSTCIYMYMYIYVHIGLHMYMSRMQGVVGSNPT